MNRYSDTDFHRDAARGFRWTVVAGVLGILAVLILGAMAVFGFGFFARTTAEFRGETEAREQTVADGGYRNASYEQFYDQCQAIVAIERKIARMQADTSLPESQRATNVLAQQNIRDDLITEYNADAAKSATVGQFRADDLPHRIDPDQETTCE